MIVENPKAGTDDRLLRNVPGHADARREVCLVREARIVVPAQAQVECEFSGNLPVVLYKESVVVIPQAHLVVLRSGSRLQGNQVQSRIDRAKLGKIGLGGKELGEEVVRLRAVDSCVLIIPSKFQVVRAKLSGDVTS